MNKDRILYYIGTGLLLIALIEVTVVPYIIMRYFPSLFIPINTHKKVLGGLYFSVFLFYVLSDKNYFKKYVTIFTFFIIYVVFQIIFQYVSNF